MKKGLSSYSKANRPSGRTRLLIGSVTREYTSLDFPMNTQRSKAREERNREYDRRLAEKRKDSGKI